MRTPLLLYTHWPSSLAGRSGAPQRGLPSILLLSSFPLRISVISFQAAVVHAVVHRVGAGDAGAEYDVCQCIHLCLPLLMCTATLVIVIVPVRVSELVDDDNHLLHRGYEGLDDCEW